jgi:cyclophilin family peptidyl-prolyl cis-trans isomerase
MINNSFQLHTQELPKSTRLFLDFVTGENKSGLNSRNLCYQGTQFHRLVPNGWIQGGLFTENGQIFQLHNLADENFTFSHGSFPGKISFVNKGPNTNYSQFMISLKQNIYFDKKFVCFGECLNGVDLLKKVSSLASNSKQTPVQDIKILNCQIIE